MPCIECRKQSGRNIRYYNGIRKLGSHVRGYLTMPLPKWKDYESTTWVKGMLDGHVRLRSWLWQTGMVCRSTQQPQHMPEAVKSGWNYCTRHICKSHIAAHAAMREISTLSRVFADGICIQLSCIATHVEMWASSTSCSNWICIVTCAAMH